MDQSRLQKTFSTIHLVYHRNKNQHGNTAWWKWLSLLRRSLLKLLSAARNEKKRMQISKYMHTHIIPKSYAAFSTVVADGQFSTLGTVLLAALAQTKKTILPLPQPRRQEDDEINESRLPPPSLSVTAKTNNDTDNDLGTPIRRVVVEDVDELPKTQKMNEQQEREEFSHDIVETPQKPSPIVSSKKAKKSKTKKKKSANAIDDIFNALR